MQLTVGGMSLDFQQKLTQTNEEELHETTRHRGGISSDMKILRREQ
jgi:hypothetical protein